MVTCDVQQVRADGVDSVVAGERGVGLRRFQLLQPGLWTVDHGGCDDAIEGDHRSRRDAVE
jgi:hypothetical protein